MAEFIRIPVTSLVRVVEPPTNIDMIIIAIFVAVIFAGIAFLIGKQLPIATETRRKELLNTQSILYVIATVAAIVTIFEFIRSFV